MQKPVLTKIAGKFQVTVPLEIRDAFGLEEGDLLEWTLQRETSAINIIPKRAQLITPLVKHAIADSRQKRAQMRQKARARTLVHGSSM